MRSAVPIWPVVFIDSATSVRKSSVIDGVRSAKRSLSCSTNAA